MRKDQFLKGTAELVILELLGRREMYGYQISKKLIEIAPDVLSLGDGTLYPILHRMEDHGLVRGKWVESAGGRRQRRYSITRKGQKELAGRRAFWRALTIAVRRVAMSAA